MVHKLKKHLCIFIYNIIWSDIIQTANNIMRQHRVPIGRT